MLTANPVLKNAVTITDAYWEETLKTPLGYLAYYYSERLQWKKYGFFKLTYPSPPSEDKMVPTFNDITLAKLVISNSSVPFLAQQL